MPSSLSIGAPLGAEISFNDTHIFVIDKPQRTFDQHCTMIKDQE